jgi:hypothetical protein
MWSFTLFSLFFSLSLKIQYFQPGWQITESVESETMDKGERATILGGTKSNLQNSITV